MLLQRRWAIVGQNRLRGGSVQKSMGQNGPVFVRNDDVRDAFVDLFLFENDGSQTDPVALEDGSASVLGQCKGGALSTELYFPQQVWEDHDPYKKPHCPADENHHGQDQDQ